jgi:hypothetical protein
LVLYVCAYAHRDLLRTLGGEDEAVLEKYLSDVGEKRRTVEQELKRFIKKYVYSDEQEAQVSQVAVTEMVTYHDPTKPCSKRCNQPSCVFWGPVIAAIHQSTPT